MLPATTLNPQLPHTAVFEPRYLQMMRDIQDATPPDSTPRFGHIMSPLAAPPAMLEDTVSGLPRLGVAVNIKSFDQQPDGSVLVHYEAARRFWLLSMWQESPYYQACVSWWVVHSSSGAKHSV